MQTLPRPRLARLSRHLDSASAVQVKRVPSAERNFDSDQSKNTCFCSTKTRCVRWCRSSRSCSKLLCIRRISEGSPGPDVGEDTWGVGLRPTLNSFPLLNSRPRCCRLSAAAALATVLLPFESACMITTVSHTFPMVFSCQKTQNR